MSDNTGAPDVQVETTSVFRADLLKEMESGAGAAPASGSDVTPPAGAGMLVVKRGPNAGLVSCSTVQQQQRGAILRVTFSWMMSLCLVVTLNSVFKTDHLRS
ncbi:Oxoglutarate dehydrogenase inhibitor [Corynebacterium diphtheriae subsp. lausannense]|nr:Oxoglutarate dehydrogenase inhibitor [Corynebacterium diphtheriae subsp. lausannense]